ncbi:uncharacterized protein LACBIDRAFT_179906 [Laccaria bicolor S238N-H82]|uniref:Predicted protein n=1 Tax=Laccaria bicolor (strain S238N-H82 / ATCC MYA-4686) TaxID=486041 RepID=B0DJQ8_LACBS|nr:uncharacterized protein LACBIDRAFT_179906 [Laccaria bicolor S238N-H82]EDR05253.1 predicted protein [Laccaria bicolor S238N-H82]|eukprot:XP_001884218.1 predicted protein [Laccaria bicolor S238N-H82]
MPRRAETDVTRGQNTRLVRRKPQQNCLRDGVVSPSGTSGGWCLGFSGIGTWISSLLPM